MPNPPHQSNNHPNQTSSMIHSFHPSMNPDNPAMGFVIDKTVKAQ
jgi:hypothetical protein